MQLLEERSKFSEHIFTPKGVETDPEKIEAMEMMETVMEMMVLFYVRYQILPQIPLFLK